MRAGDQEAEENGRLHGVGDSGQSPAVSDGGVHVYAHRRSERAVRTARAGSEEVGFASHSTGLCVLSGWLWLSSALPPAPLWWRL